VVRGYLGSTRTLFAVLRLGAFREAMRGIASGRRRGPERRKQRLWSLYRPVGRRRERWTMNHIACTLSSSRQADKEILVIPNNRAPH